MLDDQERLPFAEIRMRAVQPGDIYALGRHRLMCGDATNKNDVARLFDDEKPTIVVTSPPYVNQRDYDRPITCWDTMMISAFGGHSYASNVQLLINLGVVHHKGEWQHYWANFVVEMRKRKWKHVGLYVWDKLQALPGRTLCKPRPSHEFILHFHMQPSRINNRCAPMG